MDKFVLYDKIQEAISDIHYDVFPDIDVNEILSKDDIQMSRALDAYAKYFEYIENKDKYNLEFCFKSTLKDLRNFYSFQEEKLENVKIECSIHELEHKVNTHIYEEVIICQKKVNRGYLFNAFITYLFAFLLLFGMNQITHLLEISTWFGGLFLAMLMAFIKVLIDKRYLTKLRHKIGWKAYKQAIKRSLSFYFASVVLWNVSNQSEEDIVQEHQFLDMRHKVRSSIDILLSKIIV